VAEASGEDSIMTTTRRDLFKLGTSAATAAAVAGSAPVAAASAAPAGRGGRHSRLPVGYPLGPFVRDPSNPILRPTNRPWESRFVFNPAAIVRHGRVHLLYRAQGPDLRSSIGLATSSDGVHFDRRDEPVLVATEPYELPGGCEDPRVVRVGRTYYMTYTGYDGSSARLCLATSANLIDWTKHGPLFGDFETRDVGKPWSKSGAILTRKVIDPATGRRRYVMYFGDKDIYFAWSDDLLHWTPGPVDQPVMRPEPGTYSAELLEPGPPPLITENGYILLIHNSAAHDPDGKLVYRAGQALIDPAAPTEELARLTRPFLVPETPDETAGQVDNVVFVEGLVAYRGEWLLYYGEGDAGVGVLHGRSRTACG
jgi:beta-1,2-mannosidase